MEFQSECLQDDIFYENLMDESHKDLRQIDMDVKRTFNKPDTYDKETADALRAQLRRVLLAYCNFDPVCGYIQGKKIYS